MEPPRKNATNNAVIEGFEMSPATDNPNEPKEVSMRTLANAVEALANILYLIEKHIERPEDIRIYLGLADSVMASLKERVGGSRR